MPDGRWESAGTGTVPGRRTASEAETAPPAKRHRPTCMRCGFEVRPRAWGCKNPCANCGFVYPLGDCSD